VQLAAGWMIEHLLETHPLPLLGRIGVSTHTVAQFIVCGLLLATFIPFGIAVRKPSIVPRGPFVNLIEAILIFLRDDFVRPFLGKEGDKFLPVLWTMFFYILYCNLLGLVPLPLPIPVLVDTASGGTELAWHIMGGVTATGQILVTFTLALMAGMWWHCLGIREQGLIPYIKNIVPGGLPPLLVLPLFFIELVSHVIKIMALAIRLWANMMGGHTVLYVILGMIFLFSSVWYVIAPFAVAVSIAIYMLEIFVAFLQAYVFTFLVTVFLGAALHPDH
jgi:F-type H+-transporting ATPase subunit a